MSVINSVHAHYVLSKLSWTSPKKRSVFLATWQGRSKLPIFVGNVGHQRWLPRPLPSLGTPTYGVRTNMAQPSLVSQAAPAHHPKDVFGKTPGTKITGNWRLEDFWTINSIYSQNSRIVYNWNFHVRNVSDDIPANQRREPHKFIVIFLYIHSAKYSIF